MHWLIRKGNTKKLFPASHIIKLDITNMKHSQPYINFFHHNEIIENYETVFNQERDDIEGKFYSMPNDENYSEVTYRSNTIDSITNFGEEIKNIFSSFTLVKYTLIGIVGVIILFGIMKIFEAALSIKKMLRKKKKKTNFHYDLIKIEPLNFQARQSIRAVRENAKLEN